MWDAASAWSDEQCHVRTQDSNQRNTGLPTAERANLTTRPRGQPLRYYFSTPLKHLLSGGPGALLRGGVCTWPPALELLGLGQATSLVCAKKMTAEYKGQKPLWP